MKMKSADKVSEISAEARHFLQDCVRPAKTQISLCIIHSKQNICRSSNESLDSLLISAKQ